MIDYSVKKHKVLTAGGATEICLNEFVYKAPTAGKVLYIQAGLHGGETSQWVLYQLHSFLMNNLKCGEVHVVPYANPMAWMQRAYFSTFGKFSLLDGKDFNRCFPGNAHGDVNARICAAIFDLATKADFVLDLHTSKSSNPFAIYTKFEYEPIVKACGLPYNQYSDDASIPSLHGTLNAALDRAGIANIAIECGGHNEYDENKIAAVYQAVSAVLSELKLVEKLKGKALSSSIYRFEKRNKIFSPACGLFKPEKKLGSKLKKGEVIGWIANSENLAEKINIIAPIDGILQILTVGHIMWEGDVLAEIVPLDDLHLLA